MTRDRHRPAALLGATLAALIVVSAGCTEENSIAPEFTRAQTGNNAPSGSHYNLNIIGVPQDKTADMKGASGHVIFVQLNGGEEASSLNGKDFAQLSKINKIFLTPGTEFQVLDANATDGDGAEFQLPSDVSTTWTVWARELGKPGGEADMTTCATQEVVVDPITGETIDEVLCSLATLHLERKKHSKFSNVSDDLLFVTVEVDPLLNADLATCLGVTETTEVSVVLFNTCFQNYFWNYENKGLKLLQLRFYPVLSS